MSGQFWVFRCIKCGQWAAKEIRTSLLNAKFQCKRCRANFTLKKKRELGITLPNHGPYEHPSDATCVVQELNNRRVNE